MERYFQRFVIFLCLTIWNGIVIAQSFNDKTTSIVTQNASANISSDGVLDISLTSNDASTVVLSPKSVSSWNLSRYHGLQMKFTNVSKHRLFPEIKITSPNSKKWQRIENGIYLEPGETKTLLVYFTISGEKFKQVYPYIVGMNGGPGTTLSRWSGIDLQQVNKIRFSTRGIDGYISAEGSYQVSDIKPFRYEDIYDYPAEISFPFVDEFGQFLQGKYPGKLVSSSDWQQREKHELNDLASHPGPNDRSKWGGWLSGPKHTATGYFYVKEINNQWWFVDPDGYLFWSHGVTGVGIHGGRTTIDKRDHYFVELVDAGKEAQFHVGKNKTDYDFVKRNLFKKYGPNWRAIARERNHSRLLSWGMNTIANWSEPDTYSMNRTPYTIPIHYKSRMLEEKFPDPWDEDFSRKIIQTMEHKKSNEFADSPWNMGFFVNNELHWHQAATFGEIITSAPADQPAKLHFVSTLKQKYQTISDLNKSWRTEFSSFDALLKSQTKQAYKRIKSDADQFYYEMTDRYFRLCRDAVKSVFPNHLYFGPRLHGEANVVVLKAAEKYTDVIAYNLYRRNIRDFTSRYPDLKKPLMATEFHFGAMDRGMFNTGLVGVSNQKERAQFYYEYVSGALNNPLFVGTHWFQYRSQAITGRGDGENYQIGLVDITDTPYPETIQALRNIGYQMYQQRWKLKNQ